MRTTIASRRHPEFEITLEGRRLFRIERKGRIGTNIFDLGMLVPFPKSTQRMHYGLPAESCVVDYRTFAWWVDTVRYHGENTPRPGKFGKRELKWDNEFTFLVNGVQLTVLWHPRGEDGYSSHHIKGIYKRTGIRRCWVPSKFKFHIQEGRRLVPAAETPGRMFDAAQFNIKKLVAGKFENEELAVQEIEKQLSYVYLYWVAVGWKYKDGEWVGGRDLKTGVQRKDALTPHKIILKFEEWKQARIQ